MRSAILDAYLLGNDSLPIPLAMGDAVVLGRGDDVDLVLTDALASRNHCRLCWSPQTLWTCEDLGSANGTFVNEERLTDARQLADGDTIRCAGQTLTFRLVPGGTDSSFLIDDSATNRSIGDTITLAVDELVGEIDPARLRDLLRFFALTGKTGRLALGAELTHDIWFVDGAPRAAQFLALTGLPALIRLCQEVRGYFRFDDGLRNDRLTPIEGTAEAILFIIYGPNENLLVDADDLSRAEDLQQRMVTQVPEVPGYQLASYYQGLSQVSGDLYDVGHLADGRLLLTVGDVAGHGIQGAMAAASLLKALRLLRQRHHRLTPLIEDLNRDFMADALPGQFVTLAFAAVDCRRGRVEVILAGHHPFWLIEKDGGVKRLGESGMALGLTRGPEFTRSLKPALAMMRRGATLIQCSDGLIEAADAQGDWFGEERLQAELSFLTGIDDLEASVVMLVQEVRNFAAAIADDLTVLALHRMPRKGDPGSSGGSSSHRVSTVHPAARATAQLPVSEVMAAAQVPMAATGERPTPQREMDRSYPLLERRLEAGGDYLVDGTIASGGMGSVMRAKQAAIGRDVALKVLASDRRDSFFKQKLVDEARLTAALAHPGVPPIHDLGVDQDGTPFYAMELIEGENWQDLLHELPLERNLDILLHLCEVAAFAHDHGIVHRDIKPDNVLIGAYGQVIVVDWGVAARFRSDAPLAHLAPAPHPGLAVGTPAYMAPEMARAEVDRIGPRSDVYLLGGILYEICTGRPPHRGRSPAVAAAAAAANHLTGPDIGDGLLGIALIALAADPDERPGSALRLREDLLAWREHRASIQLAAEAEDLLDDAEEENGYESLIRAITTFEQSIKLWDENGRASNGLADARLAYAERALDRGDLELAESLLSDKDPNAQELLSQLRVVRRDRERDAETQERLAALKKQLDHDTARAWIPIYEPSFRGPDSLDSWTIRAENHRAHDGILHLEGGSPQVAILPVAIAGDVAIELEARQSDGQLGDITVMIAAAASSIDQPAHFPETGYQFKIGGYDNTLTFLVRKGRRLWVRHHAPLIRGEWMRIRFELVGRTLVGSINGTVLFATEDSEPLSGPDQAHISVGGWMVHNEFRYIRVERLGKPLLANLIDTAERHLRLAHHRTAADLFADVLDSQADEVIRERARQGLKRAESLGDLASRLPEINQQLLTWCASMSLKINEHGLELDITKGKVASLEALRGLPITALNCAENQITDLDPLRGMPLTHLRSAENKITDLESLAGMNLQVLEAPNNDIRELAALADCPLTVVNVMGNPVHDLSALARCPIGQLNILGTDVSDLSILAHSPITVLLMAACKVTDLSPLADTDIVSLDCRYSPISDLSPLANLRLGRLTLGDCPGINDLGPLRDLPLIELDISNTAVRDLTPLAGVPLRSINISGLSIDDLSPLEDCPLEQVECSDLQTKHRGPLAKLIQLRPGFYVSRERAAAGEG